MHKNQTMFFQYSTIFAKVASNLSFDGLSTNEYNTMNVRGLTILLAQRS